MREELCLVRKEKVDFRNSWGRQNGLLPLQNHCHLKLLHKLYHQDSKSSCSQKKKRTIPPRRLSEAPLLLALTRTPCGNCSLSTGASLHSVQVRNGRSTNFCEDVSGLMIGHWRVGSFNPILHCHARRVDISISTPLTTGVASLLAPRLTLVTLTELLALTNILTDFSL
jgi:hypothetical protein